jgi:hypothetical protein
VQAGHRSGDTTQILDGIKPGERITLKDPTEVVASK